MKGLTDRQREVLAYLLKFCAENRRPPGVREIGAGVGIASTNGAMDNVRRLQTKGYVVQAKAGTPHSWWPCRDVDGAPIVWRLVFERRTAEAAE